MLALSTLVGALPKVLFASAGEAGPGWRAKVPGWPHAGWPKGHLAHAILRPSGHPSHTMCNGGKAPSRIVACGATMLLGRPPYCVCPSVEAPTAAVLANTTAVPAIVSASAPLWKPLGMLAGCAGATPSA